METTSIESVMELSSRVQRGEKSIWKQFTFQTILKNDFNSIPPNFTAVFLRCAPVQLVPNELLLEIKLLSVRGFMHDPDNTRLICFYNVTEPEGEKLYREIMAHVVQWMDKTL